MPPTTLRDYVDSLVYDLAEQLEGAEYREAKLLHQFDGLVEQYEDALDELEKWEEWALKVNEGDGGFYSTKTEEILKRAGRRE